MHLLSISVDFALSSGHLGDLACQTRESKIASSVAGRLFILTYVPWRSLALVPQGFSRMFRSVSVYHGNRTFCFWSALHCHKGTLAILLPSPASHEGTLAILRFQEDLGDLGTKYDGGLHARPPRFRGTQGTLAILGPRGHSSGPIRKQRKFPDFKVRRSSGAIFWMEFDCIKQTRFYKK